ncbi:hypothetical protein SEA_NORMANBULBIEJR_83 [Mycobacterium phage NormanBulbieJr]|uniref:Uncharacterized protein n=1 Tax=Mycobacterium phage Priscilla TaxID=2081627 RepID=A0A2P1A2N1_9CAUD|nr:hypothetical protein I5H82_gp085 [Mycobacterium phage Priscilla]AVI04339.1 hypothetical protein SEA_PRISCILLA_85 [Mycobacterium phage Priscilla]AWY03697.1 hypothetical protein SEA_KOELLA_77 [Mycobacterium phage Koella]AXC38346.1 hypothetical protein SEA_NORMANBULBIEJR_83 [Mycobacterium phage NormanBulbieJr]
MSDVVERAKAALEGVTDGPWRWGDEDDLITADSHARPVITVNCYNESVNVENPRDSQFIAQARSLVPELIAEVERLHTWDGLMELLDEHWPADIFPTLPDDDKRDPGPRIISLLRWVSRLRAQETRIRELCEDPSHGPLYPYKILAALDTEGER